MEMGMIKKKAYAKILFFLIVIYFLTLTSFGLAMNSTQSAYSIIMMANSTEINPGETIELYIEIIGKGTFDGLLTIISDMDNIVAEKSFVKVYRVIDGALVEDDHEQGEKTPLGSRVFFPIEAKLEDDVFRFIYGYIVLVTDEGTISKGEHTITSVLIGTEQGGNNFVYENDLSYKIKSIWEINPWLSRTISALFMAIIVTIINNQVQQRKKKKP